jgi:hypothetical protein
MREPGQTETEALLQTESEFHLSYDATVPCVAMVWRGYHTTPSFREKNEQVLAMIRERKASRILCDIRRFLLISAADQVWLSGDWLPRAMAAGLRHCAIVTPAYFFNQVAVRSVADQIDAHVLRVDHFESEEQARLWLQRIPAGAVAHRLGGVPV